jgi:hypothetical protein
MVLGTLEILYDPDQLTQSDARRLLSRVIPPRSLTREGLNHLIHAVLSDGTALQSSDSGDGESAPA